MEENSLLLRLTGDMPLFRIVDFLVENKGLDFSKSEIAKGAEISRASLFNYWGEVERHGMVKVTRQFGKAKLYTLNVKNPVTQKILELEKALISSMGSYPAPLGRNYFPVKDQMSEPCGSEHKEPCGSFEPNDYHTHRLRWLGC